VKRQIRHWLLGAAALSGWACGSPEPGPWVQEEGFRWRELAEPSGHSDGLTRLDGARIGIEFTNVLSEDSQARNRILGQGSGVAFGDVDGDGLVDVFFAASEGGSRLFRNRGGWRFEDVTEGSGIDLWDTEATSVVFADVDGDRDLDLFVGALEGPNHLFVNDGEGGFTDRATAAGLVEDRGSMTAAFADIDGDGDLDLYVGNNRQRAADDVFHPADRSFERIIVMEDGKPVISPRHRGYYRVSVQPDGSRQRVEFGEPDDFYLNDGNGNFERMPFDGGRFFDHNGEPVERESDDWALAARFHDLDGDLDPDLYVANDFESNDHIWINRGDGTFQAIAREALRTTSAAAMAVDFSDVDRDGREDIFVVDMLATTRERFQQMRQLMEGGPVVPGVIDFRVQRNRNTLFVQRPDGTFQEMANYAGVEASNWSWGMMFLDVDLDGFEDLLINNGYQWDQQNMDMNRDLAMNPDPEWQRTILKYPTLRERNVAFRNMGDSTFQRADSLWGWGEEPDVSQGLAAADVDGDGDLDLALNRMNDPALLYRNDAQAARLAVRLRGADGNTNGVGSKIRVLGGSVPEQVKEVSSGGIYLSHAEPLYSFAAGSSQSLTIRIDWRSGRHSVIEGALPGRLYEITEPAGGLAEPVPGAGDARSAMAEGQGEGTGQDTAPPLFEDVSELIAPAYHMDVMFDDFARQPLLPMKLSQLGPGVTWHDWDSDGDLDLIVPGGRGGDLIVYRNDGHTFGANAILRATVDQSAAIPMPGMGLLVGQSNYEAPTPDSALAIPGLVSLKRSGAQAVAAPDLYTSGPIAVADMDGDGDLDAFLGGRTIPTRYPMPAGSRVFSNDKGRLSLDTLVSAPFRSVGMVSGAVFSDVDGDGDPDLVLALEWGPMRLFINEGGRFRDATERWGLWELTNRWNGVNTVDADGDGRMDLVGTAWGRNTSYTQYAELDAQHPLRIYGQDFDADGVFDVIESFYDPVMGAYVPRARLERLRGALRYVQRRSTPTNADYVKASVQEVVGPGLGRAYEAEAVTLDHFLFLNRGDHFEPVALPQQAQLAPAFHVGAADVDGDGAEDLFLSQNFFPTERNTFRFDAGQGLVLRGDGTGGFRPLPATESGLAIYGEQRGAAFGDFDQDGRVDLAVSQNGAETKLYRNVGAKQGLRVRLVGSAQNPSAIGATIRMVYADGMGPAREIHAGAGYWSYDGPVQVMGLRETPEAVWVRWPGGEESTTPLNADTLELVIRKR
jgi:enediyne biosynthesis protein E4